MIAARLPAPVRCFKRPTLPTGPIRVSRPDYHSDPRRPPEAPARLLSTPPFMAPAGPPQGACFADAAAG